MTLTANRESTNEIACPKDFNSDTNPKDFTRDEAQTISPINTEFSPIDKSNFSLTDSKMQKEFNYDYHHWGANIKVMEL